MRIGMLMTPNWSTRRSPLMPEVLTLLRQWGATVEVIYAEDRCTELGSLRVEHDLYVLKTDTELGLSFAGALHAVRAPILNPWPAAVMMKDKIAAIRRLMAAGVPVPETWVISSPQRLARLLEVGPLVIRPCRRSGGRAARIVWDTDELDDAGAGDGPMIAQRYHRPEGAEGIDRKIYCIGGQLFGVLRRWPARTFREKCGEPFTITRELRDIALGCAEAFGVELFGADVILSEGRFYLVDIHGFPGFKGVPDAALRLADYIYASARRAMAGDLAFAAPSKQLKAVPA
jgi:ribosomal protein S6--L-glutamate ligase